ncbi:Flp pilus assembly complex ATPase component TadA [Candidatus Berkelbacteria bacterium]|nr:Flp pilus assembly complex ATPase component TadA [Candidatus Berkelbacteria bacterium]MBI2588403.1 Flp pilus assembly complex ATPase component TadA [Candidatus Berkelbacteria bacterium]
MAKEKDFLEFLVKRGLLKKEDLTELKKPYKTTAEVLEAILRKRLILEKKLLSAYSVFFGLPVVSLLGKKIKKDVFSLLSRELMQKYQIIPFALQNNVLHMAIARPWFLTGELEERLEKISRELKKDIRLAVTSVVDFESVLYPKTLPANFPSKPALQNIETVDLKEVSIPKDVLERFPKEVAEKYQMVVFEAASNTIRVAAINPKSPEVKNIIDFIEQKNKLKVEIYQTDPASLQKAFDGYTVLPAAPPSLRTFSPPPASPVTQPTNVVSGTSPSLVPAYTTPTAKTLVPRVKILDERNLDQVLGQSISQTTELLAIIRTGFAPKIVAAVLSLAIYERASDIHLEPQEKKVRVRIRVDGVLRELVKLPSPLHAAMVSRIKILANLKIDETRIPQDGRFSVVRQKTPVDVRVSTLPTIHGEKVALRLLDKTTGLLTLDQLGLEGYNAKTVEQAISQPYGVILATGPTGSGKSTTLYAILEKLSRPEVNIITLEDPVEYEIENINQTQVKPKIGFSFAEGLRSVLRQDPNIIMVGEIRDKETASLVTHAALTGHLVLSTLHTNDAAGALPRLINMGVEPFLITSAINAVVAQRLVRRLCEKCKKKTVVSSDLLEQIKDDLAKIKKAPPYEFYEAVGCDECKGGYKGRLGLFETMLMTDALEEAVIAHKTADELKVLAIKQGMLTMREDGLIKALEGLTALDEIWRATAEE